MSLTKKSGVSRSSIDSTRWRARFLLVTLVLVGAGLSNVVSLATGRLHDGSDLTTHYRWAVQFYQVLTEGTWYPRWLPLANGGLGEPTFVVMHPGWYYVVSALHWVGLDMWLAMRVAAATSTLALGLVAFHFLRMRVSIAWAVLAVAVLQGLPLATFLLGSHAALPWHFSFPIAAYVLARSLLEGRSVLDSKLALAFGLLCIFHLMVAFMVATSLGIGLLLIFIIQRPRGWPRVFLAWSISMVLGLALAAAYWMPAILSGDLFASPAETQREALRWENSFVFPFLTAPVHGVRWAVVQWWIPLLPLVQLLAAAILLYQSRAAPRAECWALGVKFLVVGFVAFVLASDLSYFLYAYVPFFAKVQFPYRFITVASLVAPFALVLALMARSRARYGFTGGVQAMVVFIAALSLGAAAVLQIKQARDNPPARLGSSSMQGLIGYSSALPASARAGWQQYVGAGGFEAECQRKGVQCVVERDESHSRVWRVESPTPVPLLLPVFSFPAWNLMVDGVSVPQEQDQATGVIVVQLPAGKVNVSVQWKAPLTDRVGLVVSGLALLLLALQSGYRLARPIK